jgi:CheY-like chemotaxis protein
MHDEKEPGPRVLVVNDDRRLLNSHRLLLEDCGAQVFTARGESEAIVETLTEPVDLVIIDVTNGGLQHGMVLCDLVKTIHPSQCVALLVKPEVGLPSSSRADRVIFRTGPRRVQGIFRQETSALSVKELPLVSCCEFQLPLGCC